MTVQTIIGIKPHAIGGDSHSASTLTQFNSKISDATLDDSGDPRDPNAHATTHQNGGSDEISVAGLSGLLADDQNPVDHASSHLPGGSDALTTAAPSTAIGTDTTNGVGTAPSFSRSDHSHEVNVSNTQVTSVANFTTSSVTDVLITGMTITPGAGTYLVMFSAKATGDGGAKNGIISLYANGTQVAHTERVVNDLKGEHVGTQAIITVAAAQAIEARGRGDTTLYVDERSLIVTRLA